MTTPTVTLYPINYMGMDKNYDRGLVLSNFPTIAWSGDAWKAWWAQNKGSVTSAMIASAMTTVASVSTSALNGNANSATTTAIMGEQNLFNQAYGIVGKKQDLENTPPQTHGQIECDSLNAQMGKVQFTFEHQTVRAPFAKLIDDFFTMFGYAQNALMTPNLHARPHWTFIKTVSCVLTGSLPSDDAREIVSIFNSGITWWMKGDEIGDYSLDNRPTN